MRTSLCARRLGLAPWLLLAALAAPILAPAASAQQVAANRGLSGILRDQLSQVDKVVGRASRSLADETRLAIAASGLTSMPEAGGAALLVRERRSVRYTDAVERAQGFHAALDSRDRPTAIAFALSLALSPPPDDRRAWREACDYLGTFGADFDEVLTGVLDAPPNLPLLPSLQYAAADVLVCRASPSLLSLLAALARSGDVYIRSRAIIGIGAVCYTPGAGGDYAGLTPLAPLRQSSISSVQQRMFDTIFHQAARDGSYRVRAAAALAMGLRADDNDLPLLQRMLKDRAYTSVPAGSRTTREIDFPVRDQAVRSLARYGRVAEGPPHGVYSAKELRTVLRGGQDVTNDRRGLKKGHTSLVRCHEGDW